MRFVAFFTVWLLFAGNLRAQVFYELYFGDPLNHNQGHSVIQFPDSTLYYSGITYNSHGNSDYVLFSMDKQGNILSQVIIGDSMNGEFADDLVVNPNGDLFLVGKQIDQATARLTGQVFKLDAAGNILWEARGEDPQRSYAFHMGVATPDGGIVVVGYATQLDLFSNDFLVMRFDAAGNQVFESLFGSSGNDIGMSIIATPDGGYFISGDAYNGNHNYDNYVVKIDSTGQLEWDLYIGDGYVNGNQDVFLMPDGSYTLVGESTTPDGPQFDVFINNISPSGVINWMRYVGGTGTEAAFSIIQAASGDFYAAGYSNSYSGGSGPISPMLMKFDTQMNLTGVNYFPQTDVSIAYHLIPSLDGGFYISGFSGEQFMLIHAADTGFTSSFHSYDLQDEVFSFPADHGIFPNPASDYIMIEDFDRFQLFDMQGKTILIRESFVSSIDLTTIPVGIYNYARTKENRVSIGKLIILK